MSRPNLLLASLLCMGLAMSVPALANGTWIGIVGVENARIAGPHEKTDRRQLETIVQGVGIQAGGLTWDNTTAAKWNTDGDITVARNWAYGYWDDNHGFSVDLIKGDFLGAGPNIASVGYAYRDCWDGLCLRVNPALATIRNKLRSGHTIEDSGAQLNVKLDYQLSDRVKLGFHPQYATWNSDDLGSTMKLEFNATVDLSENKRHKLMLVGESYLVNNRSTGMRTRFVGEGSPIPGYVTGTESAIKLRYVYVF